MLSVDTRFEANPSWCSCAASGEMLQVEELSPPTEPFYVGAEAQAPAHREPFPQNTSSESSDDVELSLLYTPPRKQEPGDGSNLKQGCPHRMNRLSAVAKDKVLLLDSALESESSTELLEHIRSEISSDDVLLPVRRIFSPAGGIIVGTKESPGYRSKMEDYTSIVEDFMVLTTMAGETESLIPASLQSSLYSLDSGSSGGRGLERLVLMTASLNFVGVFDGHGGTEVAQKLAKQLPLYIAQKLRIQQKYALSRGTIPSDTQIEELDRDAPVTALSASYWQTHNRLDTHKAMPLKTPIRDAVGASMSGDMDMDCDNTVFSTGMETVSGTGCAEIDYQPALSLQEIEFALTTAFTEFNDSLPETPEKTVGSTAVVALISACHVIIANVGDSRAVLRRNGVSYRLSRDHKPDQEDEEERIRKKGGRVWDFNGRRVMGLLAMTRAFGDDCLKPFGICATPEVTIVPRRQEDEFLILACDGLWDVISDEEACHLVQRCFKRAEEREASSDAACRVAAVVLFRAAFTKGSTDNISVVVVDLRPRVTPNDLPE